MAKKPWQATQDEFARRLKNKFGKGVYIHRFTDAADVRGFMGGISGGRAAKGTAPPQPADFHVTAAEAAVYVDVKHCEDPTSFPFSDIRPAQWSAGKQVTAAGGVYGFAIYAAKLKRWYIVPFETIDSHERKSIKWAELDALGMEWKL